MPVKPDKEQRMHTLDSTATMESATGQVRYVSLEKLTTNLGVDLGSLPHTVKILLENIARQTGD